MTRIKRSSRLNVTVLAGVVLLSGCGTPATGEADAPEPISIAIGEPVSPLVPGNTVEENGTQVLESLWTGLVEYGTDGAVRYTGVAEPIIRRQRHLDRLPARRLDVPRRDAGHRRVLRRRVELHGLQPERAGGLLLLRQHRGLRRPAGPGRRGAGEPHRRPGRHGDERAAGRRRPDLHGHPERALRAVPDHPRLQPLLPAARVVLRGPGGLRSPPRRQRSLPRGRRLRPRPGHHGAGLRGLRRRGAGLGRGGRVPGLHRLRHGLPGRPGRQPRRPAEDPGGRQRHRAGGLRGPVLETAASGFTFLGLPLYQERYADARVRQALSLAIDRETIAEQIFSGTRQAAGSVVPPVVDGHRADACDYCVLDVSRRTSSSTPPASTAASRSSCGSTPVRATRPGSRPSATSCAATSAWSTS